MAKLRRNHNRSKAIGPRVLIIVLGMSVALTWFLTQLDEKQAPQAPPLAELLISEDPRWFLPKGTTEQTVHHEHFSLSYSEAHEQAEWVAYELTRESLRKPNVPRTDWFEEDRSVSTGSAHHRDYTGSGYTRGHLAPAGDMAFDEAAMEASFLMSNISPQSRAFNMGIWRELEETVRDWAFERGRLYIVTGPVLEEGLPVIGQNRVSVPALFYKIVLDPNERNPGMIALLIPNQLSEEPLAKYIVSTDSIEKLTGIDFFPQLLQDGVEEELESRVDVEAWEFSESKYQLRIENWNRR